MPIRGLDHVAITVANVERTLEFYRRVLGAEVLYLDLFRRGDIPIVLMQVGQSRISVHPAEAPAAPHADRPTPGSADLCFRWDGALETAQETLAQSGVEIIDGPVPRPAADGKPGRSVYFRDPDGNLLEFLATDERE
jgi:catechol 2,3-dioxygenase-like lactoylglutathione lyase family enzyme